MKYKIGERIYEYSGEKSSEEDITEELDKEFLNDLKCESAGIIYNEHCEECSIEESGFLDQLKVDDEPSHPYDQIHHGSLGNLASSQKFTDNYIDEKTTTIIAELIDFYANKIKTMKQEFEEAYQMILELQKENKELKSRKE